MAEKERLNPKEKLENIKKLMSLWGSRENEWLSCEYVETEGLKMRLHERTLRRYLKTKENPFFDIDVTKGDRTRSCKPKPEEWTRIMTRVPIKLVNEQEELLFDGREGKRGIKPIIGIKNVIFNKYNDTVTWYDEQYQKVGDLRYIVRPKGVSTKKQEKMKSMTDDLLEIIKTSLSFEYFDKEVPLDTIYSRLGSNVTKVISRYMDLWEFMAKNYGANDKFREQMQCLQNELTDMKPEIKDMREQ